MYFVQRFSMLLLVLLSMQGCSVYMAANQPDKKDIELFKVGTPRNLILAEFGSPVVSADKDGKLTEVYSFVQGYSGGAKAGRAVVHGAADVLTLGLWEVVGTPTEATFDGSKMVMEVTYDDDERIEKVVALKKE